jgi:hypothetical protein
MALITKTDGASDDYIPTSRLWLTADRGKVVPEGDSAAAFLFAIPGRVIPRAEALRYGLITEAPAIKERVPEHTKELVPEETKKAKKVTRRRKRAT